MAAGELCPVIDFINLGEHHGSTCQAPASGGLTATGS